MINGSFSNSTACSAVEPFLHRCRVSLFTVEAVQHPNHGLACESEVQIATARELLIGEFCPVVEFHSIDRRTAKDRKRLVEQVLNRHTTHPHSATVLGVTPTHFFSGAAWYDSGEKPSIVPPQKEPQLAISRSSREYVRARKSLRRTSATLRQRSCGFNNTDTTDGEPTEASASRPFGRRESCRPGPSECAPFAGKNLTRCGVRRNWTMGFGAKRTGEPHTLHAGCTTDRGGFFCVTLLRHIQPHSNARMRKMLRGFTEFTAGLGVHWGCAAAIGQVMNTRAHSPCLQ
ncbi:hypothetical protein ZHAS_00003470 [Anopheles sinensis]|uniref:Uncharacterized protein n=1 Tax=Anopheles sinensis TaxID=74873 RepID=A0A084VEB8_ANOSI|nr:hypothetical protein ZHAS_00003470 [Anopheles sinensis]